MSAAENEEQVIGSLLLDPPLIMRLAGRLRPEDFAVQYHRVVYAAMLEMEKAGEPLSEVTLLSKIRDRKPFSDQYTAAEYIAATGDRTPTSAHWDYHARHVIEASRKRRLGSLSESIQVASQNGRPSYESLADLMAQCEDLQREFAASDPDASDGLTTADKITRRFIDDLEAGIGDILETGIQELDYALSGGLCFGEMTILAGRPSHGKTMVALQILDNICADGYECLLLSEEMGHAMLARRFVNRITPIGQDMWRSKTDELRKIVNEWKPVRSKLYIAPPCGTVNKAIQVIDNAARRDIRVVVVDYAQLLRGSGKSRYETTSDTSQRLREATSRHDLLMLCVCQLSRQSEAHASDPKESDIKESGQYEQDADVIIFVDWPSRRGEKVPGDEYWLRIRKNRNRETKAEDVRLLFDRRRQTISSPSYEWNP